jgi:hypothetical protein
MPVEISPALRSVVRSSPYEVLREPFLVVNPHGEPPTSAFSIMRDEFEVTAVVATRNVQTDSELLASAKGPYRAIRLRISSPFNAPGFIAYACSLIAEAGSNVFVISTYSFDYIMVRESDLAVAINSLSDGGFTAFAEGGNQ